MTRRLAPPLALVAVVALVAAGCGSGNGGGSDGPGLHGTITVSAAASLTEAFDELAEDFERDHPDVDVVATYDSSTALAGQILDGAPADVFASADEANMARLADADLLDGDPVAFARNELVIVTGPGNPEAIGSLADLRGAGVVSLCVEAAPCGALAGRALDAAGVAIDEGSVTRGQNARATLTAVSEGDAVAGIVYATDARSAGDAVTTVRIPASATAVTTYPIAVLAAAGEPEVAQAFLDLVAGERGRAVLAADGFLPPP